MQPIIFDEQSEPIIKASQAEVLAYRDDQNHVAAYVKTFNDDAGWPDDL